MTYAYVKVDMPEGLTDQNDIREIIREEVALDRFEVKTSPGLKLAYITDEDGELASWKIVADDDEATEFFRGYFLGWYEQDLADYQGHEVEFAAEVESIRESIEEVKTARLDALQNWWDHIICNVVDL